MKSDSLADGGVSRKTMSETTQGYVTIAVGRPRYLEMAVDMVLYHTFFRKV